MSSANTNISTLYPKEYIKAGAGAGKTYRITEKLGTLVKQGTIAPEKILAVTFTNAAASEMRTRIRTYLIEKGLREQAEKVKQATVSTIHGFGLELIERFAFEQGISPNPRQLTDAEQNQLIRKALAEVVAIEEVLYDLQKFGYQGKFNGNDFVTAVDQFKSRILAVIRQLRTLGKGSDKTNELQNLIDSAHQALEQIYGDNLSKAETLNNGLWQAIETLKQAYPDKEVIYELWASNPASRKFVNTVYSVTLEQLESDWQLWKALQTVKAPKIEKADDSKLAEDIWLAAEKLSVHPGPLEEAKSHICALLNGAVETLAIYQIAKQESGLVDFSDMVHLANQILNSSESLREMIDQYDCLIIDEFQDTNPLQFALLNRFQEAGVPTLIVGDLKQSIMGFQGSDARLFAGLLAKGEQSTDIQVDELMFNWRSTPQVMAFINKMGESLFGNAYQALDIVPKAEYQSQLPAVQKLVFDDKNWALDGKSKNKLTMNKDAFNTLANHLVQLLESEVEITDKHSGEKRPIRPSDIAVLGADHGSLKAFSNVLNAFGLKTKISQSGLMESDAVQWVLNGLKYVADTTNHYAMLDLLTSTYANQPLQPLLETYIEQGYFSDPIVDSLKEVSHQSNMIDFSSAVNLVVDTLGVWDKIAQREDFDQQRVNVLKLFELAQTFQSTQPESLEAMGIFGKNLNTFVVWINESIDSEGFDTQPQTDLSSDDSIVLSTWHASKGLEWPVVMVLNAHKEFTPRLPSIDVEYQSDDIDQMLDSSYIRFLFEFADSNIKDKMLASLVDDNIHTLRNLTYVVLTRARECVILPWFDNDKSTSLLGLVKSLFKNADFECQETNAVYIDAPELDNLGFASNKVLEQTQKDYELIPAVISPSTHHEEQHGKLSIESISIGEALDLSPMDNIMPANDVGTWVHKVYEVGLMNPALLPRCSSLLPEALQQSEVVQAVQNQVLAFKDWVEKTLNPISVQCEVAILSKNELGQTISGTIDLLVETEDGYWIIDHKTDKEIDIKKHIGQLQAYAQSMKLDNLITHLAVNWTRSGVIEIISNV